jgi:hypothetical protein
LQPMKACSTASRPIDSNTSSCLEKERKRIYYYEE